jgi:uncharacterized membrane protein YbaN (DUF454 family)
VEARSLFSPPDDSHLEKLITRLFRLEAVQTVDVDRRGAAVVINFDNRLLSGRTALQSFSAALREPGPRLPLGRLVWPSSGPVQRIACRPEGVSDNGTGNLVVVPLAASAPARTTGPHHQRIHRLVNLLLGGACFGMSIVGIMTPFIPTMPFVLATGYFLANSSPRLHELFRRSPLFGEMLTDWEERGGWRIVTKLKLYGLMIFLWSVTLTITGFSWPLVIIMGLVSSISIVTIFRVPTISDDTPSARLLAAPA